MKHTRDAILRTEQAMYLEALEPGRDDLLQRLEKYAAEGHHPISDPEVASFLAIAVRSTAAGRAGAALRIVEVGTNIGYGAVVLARAAGPAAKVVTIERSHELCEVARGFIGEAGLSERVEVREGAALAELGKLAPADAIDFAYIDCVKEEYPQYLELILPRLASGGVIVADNVLWRGLVAASDAEVPDNERARVAALRAFNRAITTTPGLRGVILPLGDGVAYAVKD